MNILKENLGKAVDYQALPEDNVIHVIKGPQFNSFSEEAVTTFVESNLISDQSDRMGYRLNGPSVAPKETADIILNLLLWEVFKFLMTVILSFS